MYDLAMPKTLNPQHALSKRLRKLVVVPNLSARKIARQDVCSYCGEPGGTVDHIKPRSKKGKTHPLNVAGACETCNSRKGSKKLLLYLLERKGGT